MSRGGDNARGRSGQGAIRIETVLKLRDGAAVDRAAMRPEDLVLLDLVDGVRTVEKILQLSRMSPFVAMRRLRSLYERELVDARDRGQVAAPPVAAPSRREDNDSKVTRDWSELVSSALGEMAPRRKQPTPARGVSTPDGGAATAVALAGEAEPAKAPPEPPRSREVPPAPATSTRTFRVGSYEVLLRIAQGGMGSIYLCRRAGEWGFQRLYTLKVVREHAAEKEEARKALLREAKIGALMSHPNVLGVVDVGSYQDQPFLVLDYVEGTNLLDLLETKPTPALIVTVLLDALRGLEHAHTRVDGAGQPLGIVHCDVSPHNVLVGMEGAARITDFGSARMAGDPEGPGTPAVGKPAYLAPEQLQGGRLDARTDVFSLGVVMWTALTGQKLFGDESYERTILNVLKKKIVPPSSFGAPPALDDICMKALTRAPEGRFASAEEMVQALHRVASAEGLLATSAQVHDWVKRTVGETIEERRRRVQAAMPGGVGEPAMERPSAPSAPQLTVTPSAARRDTPVIERPRTATPVEVRSSDEPPSRHRLGFAIAAGLLATAGLLFLAFPHLQSRGTPAAQAMATGADAGADSGAAPTIRIDPEELKRDLAPRPSAPRP